MPALLPPLPPLPTMIVGSLPQPDWLIDRERLGHQFPPRVRAAELWRIPSQFLQEAQDDATLAAVRAQEEADRVDHRVPAVGARRGGLAGRDVPADAGRRGRDPGQPVPVHRLQGRGGARRRRGTAPGGAFQLTPEVLTLGMAYVGALGRWDIARPHLEALVARTGESSSMAQLDGSDIVYVARVSVLKIMALRVEIGTRFPAARTSQGKVLLAALSPDRLAAALVEPSRSGLPPSIGRTPEQLRDELTAIRARGWALADEELAPGVRSVAVPVRDRDGAVQAAMNVTVHAAETTTEQLLREHLPLLLRTAGDVSAEWALWQSRPHGQVSRGPVGSATA